MAPTTTPPLDLGIPPAWQYTEDIVRAVGLLFLTSSLVESGLSLVLWRLASHPQDFHGNMLLPLWGMETRVKLEKIKALSQSCIEPEHASQAIKLCDKLRRVFTRRNEIAHYLNSPVAGEVPSGRLSLSTLRLRNDGTMEPVKTYAPAQIRCFALTMKTRLNELEGVLTDGGVRQLPERI